MKFMSTLSLTLFIFASCEEEIIRHIPSPGPGLAEVAPAWSFGGDKIAFYSVFDSLGERAPGIYISDTLGNSRKPTGVFGAFAKWLPGDTELVINTGIGGPGEFIILNLNSGHSRSLGVISSPQFDVSRDGQFIYYVDSTIDSIWATGIYRYRISDSSVIAINDGVTPAISCDGSVLVFGRNTICTRVVTDSTENCLSPVGNNPIWPIWADSRGIIIYDNGRGDLHVTDLSGRDSFLVTGSGPLSLSRDGLSILFSRPGDDFKIHIWRVNIDGTELRQVTR